MSQVAGGQFRLTCGSIGAGKSYLYVRLVELEAKKSGKYKHIYSNIRAHAELAEGIEPMPEDWRDCETDSLLIIDEVQMHEKFSKHFSSRRDSEIAGLTMIRHKRQDIWMISPNPTLVNKDVRDLVNQYFWLEPVGKSTTKCFCFDKVYVNMTKSVKNNAFDEFSYNIEEKYWKLYKSTEDGKASGRNYNVNMKLIGFIVGMLIVCLIIGLLLTYLAKDTKNNVQEMQKVEDQNKQNTSKASDPTKDVLPLTGDISFECRKAVNVEKPECVKFFNDLSQNGSSVTSTGQVVQIVSYNPNKPYDFEYQPQVQPTDFPRMSGVVKMKTGRLVAVDQQGNYMLNVSQDDCKRWLDGYRPFDYFASGASKQNNQVNQSEKVEQVVIESL